MARVSGWPSGKVVVGRAPDPTRVRPQVQRLIAIAIHSGYLRQEDFFGCVSSGLVRRHEPLVLALHAQVCAPGATPPLVWLYGELFGGHYSGELPLVAGSRYPLRLILFSLTLFIPPHLPHPQPIPLLTIPVLHRSIFSSHKR